MKHNRHKERGGSVTVEGGEGAGKADVFPLWFCEAHGFFESETGSRCPLCDSIMVRR